jgi:hypothetical protein
LKADDKDGCGGPEGDDNDGDHDYVAVGGKHGNAIEKEADGDFDGAGGEGVADLADDEVLQQVSTHLSTLTRIEERMGAVPSKRSAVAVDRRLAQPCGGRGRSVAP